MVGDRPDRFAMLIVCPSCASEYALDPERIGSGGRKVRCAVCRTTWFVSSPASDESPREQPRDVPDEAGSSPQTIEAEPDPPRPADRPRAASRPWPARTPPRRRTREWLAVAAILVLVVGAPAAIGLRGHLVRQVPPTSALFEAVGLKVNVIGLELADLSAALEQEGSARILTIDGEVRSVAAGPVPVPRLEFAIEDQGGEPLYRWSAKPPVPELGPGESARFTARLTSPPPDGARLVASFQTEGAGQSVALQ